MYVNKVAASFELTAIEQFLVTGKPEADPLEVVEYSFHIAHILYRLLVDRIHERQDQQFPGQTPAQIFLSDGPHVPQLPEDTMLNNMAGEVLPYAVTGVCNDIANFLTRRAVDG